MFKFFKRFFSRFSRKKTNNTIQLQSHNQSVYDSMNEEYLFDFKNYGSQYYNGGNGYYIGNPTTDNNFAEVAMGVDDDNSTQKNPIKIRVKPIDVINELEIEPRPFDLVNLDDKITVMEAKRKLIVQDYAKREVNAMLDRLRFRKQYAEHSDFFERYQNTNDGKIDALLHKYDLVMKTSDIFIPEFPDEAIKAMSDYTERVLKITGKKPLYYVIAEPDKFRKAYEKRDPILLVQSPFGFYWQILGAWDKEMLLLSEL